MIVGHGTAARAASGGELEGRDRRPKPCTGLRIHPRMKCTHFDGHVAEPRADRCEECEATLNLRVCTTCGHVGCCESQQGHNKAHAKASGHPVIKSLPLTAAHFTWFYACNAYLEP